MAVKITSVRRDHKREDEGGWQSVPEMIDPDTGEIPEFLVRGNNYVPFQNSLAMMNAKQQRRGINAPQLSTDQLHKELGRIVAQHLLLDWRGIAEPYSRDLALEVCCDYTSPVQGYVLSCAREVAEVSMEFENSVSKNSGRSSAIRASSNQAA